MYRDYFFTRKKKNSNNTFLKLIPVILHAVYNIIKKQNLVDHAQSFEYLT